MSPHGRHWLMRIDRELNVDVDVAGILRNVRFVLYTSFSEEHDCGP